MSQASEWGKIVASEASLEVEASPATLPDSTEITVSVDVKDCPRCDSLASQTGRKTRLCRTCGLTWTVITEDDERDIEAERQALRRDGGKATAIAKGQSRW